MAQSEELTQRLFEAIDTIIGQRISSLPYDQTIVCKIVDAQDSANGIYTVSHDFDTTFTAYADFTGFQVDDEVYVRIPEGDYTKQKVITGKYLEGLLIAGETQNISITGDTTYLLYDKNNQIHAYNWSKLEREIRFSYHNSADESQTWKSVLNTFSNLSMDYERANAIKLTLGNNEEVIVYFYKYNNGTELVLQSNGTYKQERLYRFAAEQYGVTAPTYIPDIEQGNGISKGFITIKPELLYAKVDKTLMSFKTGIRYYTRDSDNNYTWVQGLEAFDDSIEYYYIPDNVSFYQDDNITSSTTSPEGFEPIDVNPKDEEGNLVDKVIFDLSKNIWYWVPGEIVLDVSSLPMLNSARIYYSEENKVDEETGEVLNSPTGTFHLIYTIAEELDPEHASIPIHIQYCPSGETTNIRANSGLTFGYITELNDEVNIVAQLKRDKDGHTDIVPAITTGDTESEYYIELLINDKFGNKINNNQFMYQWSKDNSAGITANDTGKYSIDLDTHCVHVQVGTELEEGEWITYQTIHYPLAFRKNDDYYIESPTVIMYDESGVNPKYFNNFIKLKSYQYGELEYNWQYIGTSLFSIENNIMRVNNIYQGTPSAVFFMCLAKDNDEDVLWTQYLYFTKKETESYIYPQNYETAIPTGVRFSGALAAQASETSGLVLSYDDTLELSCYNTDVASDAPVFQVDSSGTLQIGYDDFAMTGHITEGARYLESGVTTTSDDYRINSGDWDQPVYFSSGLPQPMGTKIINGSASDYKIVPQLATSRIITINANTTIANTNNGQFIIATNTGAEITVTLPRRTVGLEFELMNFGGKTVTFSASNTSIITVDNGSGASSASISEKGGVIAAKYIGQINSTGSYYWVLTGTID